MGRGEQPDVEQGIDDDQRSGANLAHGVRRVVDDFFDLDMYRISAHRFESAFYLCFLGISCVAPIPKQEAMQHRYVSGVQRLVVVRGDDQTQRSLIAVIQKFD